MNRFQVSILLAGVLAGAGMSARAADPWPGEAGADAVRLTDIDPGLNVANWSGAFWNPDSRILWLACNSGYFWALAENGSGGFHVATNAAGQPAKWSPGGDFEGICQTDSDTDLVYVMDENGWIREYDVSNFAVTNATRSWDIRTQCPEAGGTSGGEGLAFVPDEFLRRQGFCDTHGAPYVSTNGMGGLMFVGYQADGGVYAFDLNRTLNTYGFVGRYKTGRAETAGLEFDRATGKLYVWHNTGSNYLEVVELRSIPDGADRRLRPLAEYFGPRPGNLEGFALAPATPADEDGGCIVTDDDNLSGQAVLWFRQFQPADDTDADGLPDGLELWHFGSVTQTLGSADADADRITNADEIVAGTDPTNSASVLSLQAPEGDSRELIVRWPSATGRTYAIQSAAILAAGFTHNVKTNIPATPPVNVETLDVSGLVSNHFFRIAGGTP